jgi:thiamine-phosphate pyrophosphorylase
MVSSALSRTAGIYRVIDANLNRAKEGLRVCEDITRFILDDTRLTSNFKNLRHKINSHIKGLDNFSLLIRQRESKKDAGRKLWNKSEVKRSGFKDIFSANIQRVKESVRVLEEFTKLDDVDIALDIKQIRYDIYELEKKVIKKFQSVLRNR